VLRDWSVGQNHGALTNGPVWGTSTGRQAIHFNGVDDYVTGPIVVPSTIGKTLCCWFRSTDGNKLQFLANVGNSILLRLHNGKLIGYVFPFVFLTGVTTYQAGRWYHAAVSASATKIDLYLDGRLEATSSRSGLINAGTALSVGATLPDLSSYYLAGQSTDILLYDRGLSSNEISLLARRPGIAYELAPRRFYSLPTPSFSAAWARRQSIIIGGGLH